MIIQWNLQAKTFVAIIGAATVIFAVVATVAIVAAAFHAGCFIRALFNQNITDDSGDPVRITPASR